MSLGFWALAIALTIMKPSTGAIWQIMCGTFMIWAIIVYGAIVDVNNKTPLAIPFEGGILKPEFGWSYYLVLFTGVFNVLFGIGAFVYIMYHPDVDHNLLDEKDFTLEEKEEPTFVAARERAADHAHPGPPTNRRRFRSIAASCPSTADTPLSSATRPPRPRLTASWPRCRRHP